MMKFLKFKVNSKRYWDYRFNQDWEYFDGPNQSAFFAKIALENLPPQVINDIRSDGGRIVDWGCAEGSGTNVIKSYFPNCPILGVDFSSTAISRAKAIYPNIEYSCENWLKNTSKFKKHEHTTVFSSNTFEHFKNPFETLKPVLRNVKKYLILLVPYEESPLHKEHLHSFTGANIPKLVDNNLALIYSKIINCLNYTPNFWSGNQILLIYERINTVN